LQGYADLCLSLSIDQITEAVTGADPAVAKGVFDAMTTMKKIDIVAIEAARHG